MGEVIVVEHAYKHGLSFEQIEYAWNHPVRKQYRGAPQEGQILLIGLDREGRFIELIAAEHSYGTVIYHAIEPPTRAVLIELEMLRRN